jgi:hypothetical protein
VARDISDVFKEAILQRGTDEILVPMITITHDFLPDPVRVCLNPEGMTSRGNLFLFYPFRFTLPEERENRAPQSKLILDNIDLALVEALRSISDAAEVTLEMALLSSPDFLEYESAPMLWRAIVYNVTTIEGIIEGPRIFYARYPADDMNPSLAPGVFFGGPNL